MKIKIFNREICVCALLATNSLCAKNSAEMEKMMKTVLEINSLYKNYGDFHLQDVNMSLEKGTLTGFIGPNGAGKTTTIKCILNMVQPDKGKITVLGMDSISNSLEIKSKLGIVLDDGHFYEDMSITKMKNLIAPMYPAWDDKAFCLYMKKFRLSGGKKIKDLSRGMRMKYALALALSHGADIFILDEPTSGLDPLARSELMEILKDIVFEEGKTVLMSTHLTSDLDKIADYLYFILDGKIILHGQKDEIKDQHAIVKGDVTILKQALQKPVAYEVPTIEDIMLYYIRRDKQCRQIF